jgi:hypothetical protein
VKKDEIAGHVARIGAKRNIGYWWHSQEERDHWENQNVGGWTIVIWILERYDGMSWIGLMWLRIGTSGGLL